MSEETKTLEVNSAALSDRGLNERRPLNEDAFLHDPERSIFAVADGVGGAEAGEVASQTAIGSSMKHFVTRQATPISKT